MAKEAKDNTAAEAPPKTPKTKPRDYTVCRETTIAELGDGLGRKFEAGTRVLVVLGDAKARTPKEARVTVAKAKVEEAELTTDKGVELNAVPAKALESGRKPVKLATVAKWDG